MKRDAASATLGGNPMTPLSRVPLCLGGLCLGLALANATVAAAVPEAKGAIAATIKTDVARMVAGINAHDVALATALDAPDLVSMESGRPPSIGAQADRDGLGMAFRESPSWRLALIDETVDVADAADMAVYRSTYDEDSTEAGRPMTHRVNYLAGFRRDPDGAWRVHWSVVCAQTRSHPK
jgi:ketosteroid isomerase-like protein